ncbi:MAG: FCD domain-containing protein [Solirubrobacteraceae bacterium]|jgi:GntR family transcriptional repressor for pyruvate dehydrogenase complex
MASTTEPDAANALSLKRAPRQKLTETVAQQLLEAISQLEPGARVPSERELTRDLGVGRSTVREALNGLALLGLVEIRHGQGVFVVDRKDVDGGPDALQRALMKGLTQEFLEARMVVEVEIVGLAAKRRTDADLQRILDTIEQLEQAREAPVDQALQPASDFNVALAEAAHNEVLAGIEESFVGLMIERASELYDTDGFREWDIEEHKGILEAIGDGDSDLAKERMRDHIVAIGEHYKRVGKI